jgi:hypothetical protein
MLSQTGPPNSWLFRTNQPGPDHHCDCRAMIAYLHVSGIGMYQTQ